MGLVLEWVYGTIVSTAEKARDGAKRALGERRVLYFKGLGLRVLSTAEKACDGAKRALGERRVLHVQWSQAGKVVAHTVSMYQQQ